MEEGSSRRTSLRRVKLKLWLCCVMFFVAGGETSHLESTMSVSAPHLNYTCPEGATAKLVCSQRGAALHSTDVLRQHWLFTPHSDEHCQRGKGPRHTIMNHHSNGNHSSPPGLQFGSSEQNFWVVLQNVTHSDQGRYCCLVLDIQLKNKQLLQEHHTHIVLRVTPRRNGSQDCTVWDPSPSGDYASVALVLAACILALLLLLLTLGHMYRQRMNTHSSRRAQELVRMDSEAHGHENPVFLGGSPQTKTRTVSQIMTRQASETGRHLLSEPGTPLSPPVHGDVFFPTEDTIPESPDLVQI